MKKLFVLLAAILMIAACTGGKHRVAKITHGETEKKVDVCWGDSTIADTTFVVPATVEDSVILKNLRVIEDSLRAAKWRVDSIYRVFQQDSTNFREITRRINGGFNGWEDRYKRWLKAREFFNNDTIN